MLGHKYCILGRLSSEVGWNLFDIIRELEKKRKDKAQLVYERKKHLNNLRVKAEKVAEDNYSLWSCTNYGYLWLTALLVE
ncbi:hypothetical protein AAZV13_12G094800 [Glycine max]